MRWLRRDEAEKGIDTRLTHSGRGICIGCDREEERARRLSVLLKGVFPKAVKSKGLERSFKQAIPAEVYERLEKEMNEIDTK